MIPYDLAKQLKDAGFPQACRDGRMTNSLGRPALTSPEERAYAPTLSELIEACGEIFCGIHKLQLGGWMAFIFDIEDSTRQVEARGKTPDQAVARLWLALKHQAAPPADSG